MCRMLAVCMFPSAAAPIIRSVFVLRKQGKAWKEGWMEGWKVICDMSEGHLESCAGSVS